MTHYVKTEVFEGPFDLLLSLVEKRKLFINDVSLAKVTDDYIKKIEESTDFSIPNTAQFIFVASTLVLIKSKSLLPVLSLTQEERGDIAELESRLRQFQKIKEYSILLSKSYDKNRIYFKKASKIIDPVFSPDKNTNPETLLHILNRVIEHIPKQKNTIPQVAIKKIVSLEEAIETLTQRIQKTLNMSFKEYSKHGKAEKTNVIVTFIAMLELVKQGIMHAKQEEAFMDITMEAKELGTPHYG